MVRFCQGRAAPPRKDKPGLFALPPFTNVKDAVTTSSALMEAVSCGDLTPVEAGELSKLQANQIEVPKACKLKERLAKAEPRTNQRAAL